MEIDLECSDAENDPPASDLHAAVEFLVNCASQEYFSSVAADMLNTKIITPTFYENTENGIKIISFYAKKARGAMARYIMENRISDPNSLLEFDLGGYKYQPEKSTLEAPVFVRN